MKTLYNSDIHSGKIIFFVWDASQNWRVKSVSESIFPILGYASEDFESGDVDYASLIHPDDLAKVKQALSYAVRTGKDEFSHEIYRVKGADNQYRYVYDHTKIIRNETGEVIEYHGYVADETKLTEQNIRLELVLSGTGLGLWDWNPQTHEVTFDERWAEMLGYKLSEIEPRVESWESRVHPDDLPKCYEDLQAHMDGKTELYENVHRMMHKDGKWRYILDRGRIVERDLDGKPTRFSGTHTDITHIKEIQFQLERKNQELKKLHDSLNEASKVAKIGFWEYIDGAPFLSWSEGTYDIFEIGDYQQKISYADFLNHLDPAEAETLNATFQHSIQNQRPYFTTHKIRTAEDHIKYVEERAVHYYDETGRYQKSVGSIYDVSEQYLAQQDLEKQRVKYHTLMNNASDALFIMSIDGRLVEYSKQTHELLGYTDDEMKNLTVFDWDKEITEAEFQGIVDALSQKNQAITVERTHTRKDGSEYTAEITANLVEIGDERFVYAAVRDITEKKQQDALILEQRNELETIFSSALEGIGLINLEHGFIKANNKLMEILGYRFPELQQKQFDELAHPDDQEKAGNIYLTAIQKGTCENTEVRFISKDGSVKLLNISMALMPNKQELLMTMADHTELWKKEQLLIEKSYTDELTQLQNRKAFKKKLNELLSLNKRYGSTFSFVIFDIDNFKAINDTFGHQAGDRVLINLSELIQTSIRENDYLFRIGGEEFVILMAETSVHNAAQAAEKLREAINAQLTLHENAVTISLGVTEVKELDDEDDIYIRADNFLYQSKAEGKNMVTSG
ncbi:PAS domain-containing protein [Thiomicrorhabdus sp. zzn3]|uniref:PAS domain-containing protein n=1 Tax=Thiomicrorhabdus sp. zzn3 TaxID=3039775 RepID=UPI0024369EAF|nr:PAS domain-containing protein [Thiomicrorhabdus sp. zzn3]MDG6778404.1 PAS domain-containing protein [Thiomicrorhabdus sp. zzn3]